MPPVTQGGWGHILETGQEAEVRTHCCPLKGHVSICGSSPVFSNPVQAALPLQRELCVQPAESCQVQLCF